MADISTLNGYNLKDAQARSNISTINDKIGSSNGIAELDENGKVPSSQLPSYVDDVIEGYYWDTANRFYEDSAHQTMITPAGGKCWVDIPSNKSYRWTGSGYVLVDEGVQIGETSDTAYAGNKGKANADAISAIKDGTSIDSFSDVESALANKQDTLTFDNSPTANSDNPVKSGGLYNEFSSKVGWLDSVKTIQKNKLRNRGTNETLYDVTFTIYDDGSVNVNGTASAGLSKALNKYTGKQLKEMCAGRYLTLTGGVSSNTYLSLMTADWSTNIRDNGNGVNIDTQSLVDATEYYVAIVIASGTANSNTKIYPMLREATIMDDEWRPWIPDNTELMTWEANGKLGAKNFLPYSLDSLKANNTGGTWNNNVYTQNGLTFTINSDLSVDVAGTASASTLFYLYKTETYNNDFTGKFLSGCPANGEDSTYFLGIRANPSASGTQSADLGEGVIIQDVNFNKATVIICINGTYAISGSLSFKPMIRLASDIDNTYQPYAMTNKELTDIANSLTPVLSEATSANTNVTVESSLNSVVRTGNVVSFTVRFTLANATSTADTVLINLPTPKGTYPQFSIRDRNAPYEEKCGSYLNPGGKLGISGIALPSGTYQVSGCYVAREY